MKKKMKTKIKSSICNIDWNIINIKKINQDFFVIKIINVEKILINQKSKKE